MPWLILFLMFPSQQEGPDASDAIKKAESQWRAEHEETIKADDSWLNLVGLFFLKEGPNPFGTSPELRLQMPLHSTVAQAGVFVLEQGKVRFTMNRAQAASLNGNPVREGTLELDQVLTHNHLRMFLIERDGRIALRVRDLRARNFLDFQSLEYYRPKQSYMVQGTFTPFDPPKTLTVTTVISTKLDLIVPGTIEFNLNGQNLTLTPTLETENDEEWLIMFQDQTSGMTTYSGGRYLYIEPVKEDGTVMLNFNRAVNPPCAYTYYATCPLPPSENWLDVAIEAGERNYPLDY